MSPGYLLHVSSSHLHGIPFASADEQRERELECETGDWLVVGRKNNRPFPPDGGSGVESSDSIYVQRLLFHTSNLIKHLTVHNTISNSCDSSILMHMWTFTAYNM